MHPPLLSRVQGRCNREKPPCKYFHPPQHLKDQLLINGRNHLALKNALMLQMVGPGQSVLPGQIPAIVRSLFSVSLQLTPACIEWNFLFNITRTERPLLAEKKAVSISD